MSRVLAALLVLYTKLLGRTERAEARGFQESAALVLRKLGMRAIEKQVMLLNYS
jgi:hypothetical protein